MPPTPSDDIIVIFLLTSCLFPKPMKKNYFSSGSIAFIFDSQNDVNVQLTPPGSEF